MTQMRLARPILWMTAVTWIFAWSLATVARSATLTFDGSQTSQVIDGFGVNANYYEWDTNSLPAVLDALQNDAGMTLFRVVFQNNWEGVNDNGDPDVMNWAYYNTVYSGPQFQKLWGLIRNLNQRGLSDGIILNFQGNGPSWMGGNTLASGKEDEWAEMIASLLVYARNTQHLQFTLVAPNNEPNLTDEGIHTTSGSQYAYALHLLATKLDDNGLSDIRFVAPDLAYGGTDYLDELMADPVVMAKLAHFGVHSYGSDGSGSIGVPEYVANEGFGDRSVWVTEFNVWCDQCEYGDEGTNSWDYALGGAQYLFGHLYSGASAALTWEGYDSFYPHHDAWSYWGLLAVDDTSASPKTYTRRKEFYTLAQITKFVRPGAQGISVNGSFGVLDVLAFYHNDLGQLTIVGINAGQNPVNLSGTLTSLPSISSLDFYYTSADADLFHDAAIAVAPNRTFSLSVPGECIFTLTGLDPVKTSVSVAITNPPNLSRLGAPANLLIEAAATTTTGTVASVSFYNGTNLLGQVIAPPYSLAWSNVLPGNYLLTARGTNSLGYFAISPGVHVTVVGPLASIAVTPAVPEVTPNATQQFNAAALDALGNELLLPPLFSWSVTGGGTIDSNGLFTAGAFLGGPFAVRAVSGSVTGQTSVTVVALNAAMTGVGYTWYSMSSPTANSPRASAPGINDGDLNTDVHLLPGTGEDISNAYEAAGVVWSTPQTFNRVVYRNGSYNAIEDGVFAANFALQFSGNGTTWTNAGPAWTLSPPYTYNSAVSADTDFTFTGGVATVRGVRCVGRVHTSETSPPPNSWVVFANELQAFVPVPGPPVSLRTSRETNGLGIWWPSSAGSYVLQSATNLNSPSWSTVTNAPVTVGQELRVTVAPSIRQQFFRLRSQ